VTDEPSEPTDALRRAARELLADAAPEWTTLAEAGWLGLGLAVEAVLHEEAGAALLHAPFWSTARLAPFLPSADLRRVVAGEASWTVADGPLVPHLDSATHVAVLGGDTVWELVGADREILACIDETRPLGVVLGGDAARPLFASEELPWVGARSLVALASEAVGVARRAAEVAAAAGALATALAAARATVAAAADAVDARAADAHAAAREARRSSVQLALATTAATLRALGDEAATWEHHAQRLRRRAIWLGAWDAPGERLLGGSVPRLGEGGARCRG